MPAVVNRRFCHLAAVLIVALLAAVPTVAATIPLLAQQTAPRTVQLTWTGNYGTVIVSRQYPDQPQPVVVGTTSDNSWTDHQHRSVCGDTVRYVVTNGTDTGFAAVFVSDNEPTAPAQWGVVTMDHTTHQIVLQWTPSADTDIMGYLICEGTPSIAIDTVFGRLNTLYAYPHEDSARVHQFRICAFDSCRQASALTTLCNNMVLYVESEPCSQDVTVTWNRYFNMPSDVGIYELWVSENDSPYQRRAQVDGQAATNATFTVAVGCTVLRTYVKAISSDGSLTALSNLVTVDFEAAARPQYLYLRRVSVDDGSDCVQIEGVTEPGWSSSDFKVYRRAGSAAPTVVGHCTPTSQGELHWQDCSAKYDETTYTYLLAVTDACGRNEMRSDEASTILPQVATQGALTTLSWNPYQGWQGTTTYRVYSSDVTSPLWHLDATTLETTAVLDSERPAGLQRYKVVAIEGPDSRHLHFDTVQSPVVTYCPQTDIWMPNAFTPLENSNNTFAPQSAYINPDGYSFLIFNRHGVLLFSTNDPTQAWDGRSRGQMQPAGSYVYTITYRQSNGADRQLTGSFLLVY